MRILITVMAVLLLFSSGCRMTRYVPDDEYLLKDVDINIDNNVVDTKELEAHLRQSGNVKILGFMRFHLWLYNLSSKKREKGFLKNIGEPPVIYDVALKNKSNQQLRMYLNNKGYYRAEVTDSVSLQKNTAKVTYNIETGQAYKIRSITHHIKDSNLRQSINDLRREPLFSEGD